MSQRNNEAERLKRLREQQIAARDPLAKEKAYHSRMAARPRPKMTATSVIKDFQLKWSLMFAGGILGAIVAVILGLAVQASWVPLVAFALIAAGLIIGRVIGAVLDWRNEGWTKRYRDIGLCLTRSSRTASLAPASMRRATNGQSEGFSDRRNVPDAAHVG